MTGIALIGFVAEKATKSSFKDREVKSCPVHLQLILNPQPNYYIRRICLKIMFQQISIFPIIMG